VGADVAEVGRAHRQDAALGIEGKLGRDGEIARLIIAQEGFVAVGDVLDRTPDLSGGVRHQRKLGVGGIASSEIAADVARRHHPNLLGCHPEDGRDLQTHLHDAEPVRDVDGVAPGLAVVGRNDRARLEVHAGHALDAGFELHAMRGARKRRVGCRRVADLGVERDVVGHVIPETRRGRFDCLRGKRHRRQRFPRNVDQLGGVFGGRERVGHHHRNAFARKPGGIGR
jgi:hypothetical protein